MKLILASGSPRRQEMIAGLDIDYEIKVPNVDESVRPGESPLVYAERVSADKARAVSVKQGEVVLAADTIVVFGEQILGKPTDAANARDMLKMLSGRTHEVITGFCLRSPDITIVQTVSTEVQFAPLSESEIEQYVLTGEPMDKAGSYAIQGGAAYMVRRIDGSYSNVVGLPLCEVIESLRTDFGFPV